MQEINYEALRARLYEDYYDRIVEDGWGRYRVADDASEHYGFEVSRKQARLVIRKIRKERERPVSGQPDFVVVKGKDVPVGKTVLDEEEGAAEISFARPTTLDEAIEHLDINEEDWEIVQGEPNYYEGQAKVKVPLTDDQGETVRDSSGEVVFVEEQTKVSMYGFRFRLQPREGYQKADFREELLRQIEDRAPAYKANIIQPKSGNLMRLLIPDSHLGKDGFQSHWGIDEAVRRVLTVVSEFVDLAKEHRVERICLPLGHDLLHIDQEHVSRSGTLHTTSSGTPVERSHPWSALFLVGSELGSAIIRSCLEVAPVDILVVPGNHSGRSEFGVGRVLVSEFKNSPDVNIDLGVDIEKYSTLISRIMAGETSEIESGLSFDRYYEWGVNAWMDTHGDHCAFNDLPLNFAIQNGALWGRSIWREVNTGHKHLSKTRPVGFATNEKGQCTVRISPSLSPQDAWHERFNFHGMPGAECFLYNKKRPGPFASYQRFFGS